MSEFQSYEFYAIDKPLNSESLKSIRSMSSRVQLSPQKAVFTYSYSDFRYDEEEVLIDYFDFMVYLANWGSKRLMMKFPPELVDYEFLRKYRISVLSSYKQDIRVFKKSGFVLLDVSYTEEEGTGWIEEGSYGYDLLNIRTEIMKGDYSSLFIIWLRFLEDLYTSEEFDLDYSFESSLIPSNLSKSNPSGHAAREFFEVNQDWLNAMSSYSKREDEEKINYEQKILNMPEDRMVEYIRMILSDEPNLKVKLVKEIKGGNVSERKSQFDRTKLVEVGEKVSKIEQFRKENEHKEKTRQELERMTEIRQNQDQIKMVVTENIDQGNSKFYKIAISKIMELRDMNDYFSTQEHFEAFLNEITSKYSRKSSFIRMLKESGFSIDQDS